MVIRIKEAIDESILYKVKRIMNDTYSVNLPLTENELKNGVVSFFEAKKEFLSGLRSSHGTNYAGAQAAAEIYRDVEAILRSSDPRTIYDALIEHADSLDEKSDTLEQLESFYRNGSHQQQNYQDAIAIIEWYDANHLLNDLSEIEAVVESMREITEMDMPFSRMSELADLVFRASEIQKQIMQKKLDETKKQLEKDRSTIRRELRQALQALTSDDQKDRVQATADNLDRQYETWLNTLTVNTDNMDSYITASGNAVNNFRSLIAQVMAERDDDDQESDDDPPIRTRQVSISSLVSVVNRRVSSAEDVEKVVAEIRKRLLGELKDSDELNLY